MPGRDDDIDAYEVLGVTPRADDVVIRAAWKALIRKYHPDSSPVPDAAERAAKINAAFKLLVTPEARAAYDRRRAAPTPAPAPTRRPAAPMPPPAAKRPAPPPRPRPRQRASRKLVLAGLRAVLIGGGAIYLVAQYLVFTAPMQRAADGFVTDPAVARIRANVRRMLGLDTPSDHGSQPAAPVADAGPPPPINEAAIAAAAGRFDTLRAQGGDAAATEGRKCIAQAENAPSWDGLDACAALHLAGLGAAEGLFGPPDPNMSYFEQAAPELREHYAAISGDVAEHAVRIEAIRKIVWAAMLRATEARMNARGGSSQP